MPGNGLIFKDQMSDITIFFDLAEIAFDSNTENWANYYTNVAMTVRKLRKASNLYCNAHEKMHKKCITLTFPRIVEQY